MVGMLMEHNNVYFNDFRKYQRNEVKIFSRKCSRKCNSIIKDYQEAIIALTNTQLSKLKSTVKNKMGKILRLNKKDYED